MYGVYMVLFGCLLNIPLIIFIYFCIAKPAYKRINKKHSKYIVFAISSTILAATILISYTPGWLRFINLCNEHTEPVIGSVEGVSHYYIDGVNPNGASLELRHLKRQFEENKILFIEGPNIFRTRHHPEEPPYIKYHLTDEGNFEYIKVNDLESTYGYRQIFYKDRGLNSHSREVYNLKDNAIISKYKTFIYYGGRLSWLTFPFGIQQCLICPYFNGEHFI